MFSSKAAYLEEEMNENDVIEYNSRTGEKRHSGEAVPETEAPVEPALEVNEAATNNIVDLAKKAAYWEARAVESMTVALALAKRLGLNIGSLDLLDDNNEIVEWCGLAINLGPSEGMVLFAVTFDWVDAIMQELELENWGTYQLTAIKSHSNAESISLIRSLEIESKPLPAGVIQGDVQLIQVAIDQLQNALQPLVRVEPEDDIAEIRAKAQLASTQSTRSAFDLITQFAACTSTP